jgi:hypothetical protein
MVLPMKHRMVHKFICGALLFYFALFVIPPVSSFATATGKYAAPDERTSLEQDHRQARLYLVDIVVWLKLKESRHPDALAVPTHDLIASTGSIMPDDSFPLFLPEHQKQLVWSGRTLRHSISGHLSRSSDIFFARSGISPPSIA